MVLLRVILLALCLLSVHALAQAEKEETASSDKSVSEGGALANNETAVVDVWGSHLLTVRGHYRHFTPKIRAQNIRDKVLAIDVSKNYDIAYAAVTEDDYTGAWILVNDERVIGLLEEDAPANLTLQQYGETIIERLRVWLERRDAQQKPQVFMFGLLYSAIASVIFGGLIWLVFRGREKVLHWLEHANNPKTGVSLLQFGSLYLMPYLMMLLSGLIRLFMLLLIGLLGYLWLAYVMRQFPYTIGYGQRLTDYIVELVAKIGLGILHSIPDLIMVGIIFWLAKVVSDIVRNIFMRIEKGRIRSHLFDAETAKATRRVIVVLVWLFSVVIAYPYIPGSETEAFKGVSVFLGLIVSLGSAGIVSQLLGGLIVVYSRAFQPGEYVRIGEYEGTVTAVGVLSTKVKTIKKEEITIPNAVLLNATSTNYTRLSKPEGVIVSTTVTIGYDTPWPQVHHLLLGAAAATEGVREQPEPQVRQIALSDWYVEYRLLVHIDEPELKVAVLSELHQHIQDAFAEADLQIMSPHFMAQPEQPLVPAPWSPPAASKKSES
ncbi:mechanosensitive ion channel family protein [Gilvimarinus xylanilyticus]|uniref:Small-conductance mechanosensitive channel n=1 Tax=Gilvimarinus xylanilyticus TaxID=2944139 RepID=A0A9X2I5J3_9GAMM|nr:mechanosensitive ion channel domain-containing protein [Gilvimarinus xylanilyticus]MCP8899842.1 mechanosensitive ion channel family protein [Gilvimarinus xylanilyticus]